MFYYFPENYTWSSAFQLALMAGAQFGEMDRWLAPLKNRKPNAELWSKAWSDMAGQQEDEAALDLKEGYRRSAGARYLRAAVYRFSGERQVPPGAEKSASYLAAMNSFTKAIELMPLPLERIEVKSPDGTLPGYLMKAPTKDPAPVVIFYSGFDVVKEMLYCFVRDEFAQRGISCLVMDTPGVGEPLRLQNVPSRPDYEVPTRSVIDYLETRSDIDSSRSGFWVSVSADITHPVRPHSNHGSRLVWLGAESGIMAQFGRSAGPLDPRASPFRSFSFLGSWGPRRWERLLSASSSGHWPTCCHS